MSIDKFGHHINSYYQRSYEDGYYTYKMLIRFESDKIDPLTKNYILFQTEDYWEFIFEKGVIVNFHAHPSRVQFTINDQKYKMEELTNMFLQNKDKIRFCGVENEHLFVELLIECPIAFNTLNE